MRRQTPIAHLLYNHLYPKPAASDPSSFSAHLARNLVPEVRIEVATFYGDLNTTESRYPGLNYCYPPHRMRLGRFKHHRKLFDAFDALGLTYNEIQDFCCWEGTKWARERYEKDEGEKVEDTTGNEIRPWVDPRESGAADVRRQSITRKTDISVIVEDAGPATGSRHMQQQQQQQQQTHQPILEDDEDESMQDDEQHGVEDSPEVEAAYNQHVAEVIQRADSSIHRRIMQHWGQGLSLPPDVEAYLKEQSEAGMLSARDLQGFLAHTRRLSHATSFTAAAAAAAANGARANAAAVTERAAA
ncbi:hypothetical protein K431DRAFT_305859 [Polychaeton citri CBS 116435]|uniref:Uncharacterized protein n=1 Tax=Polychaeton citri CBS 116435 TaxID=1314669 RepID=A0A9P4Q3B2_9PEZI|nr:hypothetical protein K431DRAFT_305859 [Polychaeton citri CBS 116435]